MLYVRSKLIQAFCCRTAVKIVLPTSYYVCRVFTSSNGNHYQLNENSEADHQLFQPRIKFLLPLGFERREWYPKHMGIQLKRMEGKLRTVDLIIEVHDSRIALTGRNPTFNEKLYSIRPHILVMNKMDLIDLKKYKEPIEDFYGRQGIKSIVWTNCKDRKQKPIENLLTTMLSTLQSERRFNRMVKTEYQVMVVGVPNVGKSSVINTLRGNNLGFGKAVKEGARPGVTTRVQNRVRIWDRPAIYLLDTPGILEPYISDVDAAMKLAACDLILESATKPYMVADYLLYYMNKSGDFSYIKNLHLPNTKPCDDIKQILLHVAKAHKLRRTVYVDNFAAERWDIEQASKRFLDLFRHGKLCSDMFLDRDLF